MTSNKIRIYYEVKYNQNCLKSQIKSGLFKKSKQSVLFMKSNKMRID